MYTYFSFNLLILTEKHITYTQASNLEAVGETSRREAVIMACRSACHQPAALVLLSWRWYRGLWQWASAAAHYTVWWYWRRVWCSWDEQWWRCHGFTIWTLPLFKRSVAPFTLWANKWGWGWGGGVDGKTSIFTRYRSASASCCTTYFKQMDRFMKYMGKNCLTYRCPRVDDI